jgi:hypothetical protein
VHRVHRRTANGQSGLLMPIGFPVRVTPHVRGGCQLRSRTSRVSRKPGIAGSPGDLSGPSATMGA